jgi:hypothetical protein
MGAGGGRFTPIMSHGSGQRLLKWVQTTTMYLQGWPSRPLLQCWDIPVYSAGAVGSKGSNDDKYVVEKMEDCGEEEEEVIGHAKQVICGASLL